VGCHRLAGVCVCVCVRARVFVREFLSMYHAHVCKPAFLDQILFPLHTPHGLSPSYFPLPLSSLSLLSLSLYPLFFSFSPTSFVHGIFLIYRLPVFCILYCVCLFVFRLEMK
jgi:hypothetical protein